MRIHFITAPFCLLGKGGDAKKGSSPFEAHLSPFTHAADYAH